MKETMLCYGCYFEHDPSNSYCNDCSTVAGSHPSKWISISDPVLHPSHYNKGTIEVWDFISDWKLNFDRGNAIKYICRAGEKDPTKEIQDLEKAIAYIEHEIKILKGEIENGKTEEN